MTYLLLSTAFTAVAAAVLVVALAVVGRREAARTSAAATHHGTGPTSRATATGIRAVLRRWALALALTAVALFVLTAVFDNLMIAVGFMVYSDAHTSGLTIGLAPLEDFTYPLAALLLLPALWVLFQRPVRKERRYE